MPQAELITPIRRAPCPTCGRRGQGSDAVGGALASAIKRHGQEEGGLNGGHQRAVSEKVIGYKVGCTSSAIQKQLGIREPIFGRGIDTGQSATGARVAYDHYANLRLLR